MYRSGGLRLAVVSAVHALIGATGCTEKAVEEDAFGVARARIIFGSDDRTEAFEQLGVTLPEELAQASAALIPASRLDVASASQPRLQALSLSERFGVCADERFASQAAAADCGATLVTPDTLLTAGHCVSSTSCAQTYAVFDYALDGDGQLPPLSAANVYSCAQIIARRTDAVHDYAMVRLDRPVVGRKPVRVAVGAVPLVAGASVLTLGYPSGLPQKVSAGASVNDPRRDTLDYFTSHLDSLPGNSGGGVFLKDSHRLVGVLARGPGRGYVRRAGESCVRPEQVADDSALQVESVYVAAAVADFCSVTQDPVLCACGDGTCAAQLDESTATCAADCGSLCGDGACNGTETGDSCYTDCGWCGNAICEPHEAARLSCCTDCGCPTGFGCEQRSCQPEVGNLNGDETVDGEDLAILGMELRRRQTVPVSAARADVDCNGTVDWADFSSLKRVSEGAEPKLPCVRVDAMALGYSHSCVVFGSGRVRCWGANELGQLGYDSATPGSSNAATAKDVPVGGHVVDIAASRTHSCILSDKGQVKCWGANDFGQLGQGNVAPIPNNNLPSDLGWIELSARAIQIASGGLFSCAILDDGRVQCWGDGTFGQLGYGHTLNVGDDETPASQGALWFGERAVQVALGDMHACVRLESGRVHCWGTNILGQVGSGSLGDIGDDELASSAEPVALGEPASAIAAGAMHSCALLASGAVRCWGDNSMGQLGQPEPWAIGDDESPDVSDPILLGGTVSELVAGESTTCVRYANGSVRCWGDNTYGELGLGTTEPVSLTAPPDELPLVEIGAPVTRLFAGPLQTCAQLESGDLRCWGVNEQGQLGYAHFDNIGDDEKPVAAGNVRFTGANDTGWSFVNDRQLSVWLEDNRTDASGSAMTLRVRNLQPERAEGLSALLSFDTSEARDPSVEVRPADVDNVSRRMSLEQPSDSPVHTLRVQLPTGLATGETGHHPQLCRGDRFSLRYRGDEEVWRAENDYFASELSFRRQSYLSQRVQIVDATNRVLYGWRRDPNPK